MTYDPVSKPVVQAPLSPSTLLWILIEGMNIHNIQKQGTPIPAYNTQNYAQSFQLPNKPAEMAKQDGPKQNFTKMQDSYVSLPFM